MNKNKDKLSAILKRAFDILFVYNPVKTSIGGFLGISLDVLVDIFKPIIKEIKSINLIGIKSYQWIVLTVCIVNLPYLWKKKHTYDKSIEDALAYIKEQEEKDLYSDWETKQMYRNLYKEILNNTQINDSVEKNIIKLENGSLVFSDDNE